MPKRWLARARASRYGTGLRAEQRRCCVLVQLTSGSPSEARKLAEWAAGHGIRYLDGKILAYPFAIGTPDAAILCAGSATEFESVKTLFANLGAEPFHAGDDPGHAATIDVPLLLNTMSLYVANLVGRAMCETEGITPEAWSFFSATLLEAAPAMVGELNALVDQRDFSGHEAAMTSWAHAAEVVRGSLGEGKLDTSLAACIAELTHRTIERGHGDDGFAAVYDVVTSTDS